MMCDKCGGEKFDTVRVLRNRAYSPDRKKFVYSETNDIRRVACCNCGRRFFTQTSMLLSIEFDEKQLTSKVVPLTQGLFD